MIPQHHRRRPPHLQSRPTPATEASSSSDFVQNDTGHHPRSLHDIYHTTSLLRQILVPDLVPSILNDAQYWLKARNARTERVSINQRGAGFKYLRSAQIDSAVPYPVRRVEFKVTSRDQGWADDRATSWTWFEASVDRQGTQEGESGQIMMKRRLCTNVAAGRDDRTYEVVWTCESEDEEREWVHSLKAGDSIVISVHAQYPGWTNNVHSAEVNVYTAGVYR
ncbi:MAG: hypothetical protein Q9160_003191 [Pyrenula sp. 1 TL-2023]